MARYIILIAAIVFNAVANILIKAGMNKIGKTDNMVILFKKAISQPALLAGIFSFGLALVAYSFVLTKLNLSIAYPVMVSMGLIVVVLASRFLLNESISLLQVFGFVLIISGVWMVAR